MTTTKRKFNPAWPSAQADTAARRTRVSRERRAKLEEKARLVGFKSLSQMMTAWLNGEIEIAKSANQL